MSLPRLVCIALVALCVLDSSHRASATDSPARARAHSHSQSQVGASTTVPLPLSPHSWLSSAIAAHLAEAAAGLLGGRTNAAVAPPPLPKVPLRPWLNSLTLSIPDESFVASGFNFSISSFACKGLTLGPIASTFTPPASSMATFTGFALVTDPRGFFAHVFEIVGPQFQFLRVFDYFFFDF